MGLLCGVTVESLRVSAESLRVSAESLWSIAYGVSMESAYQPRARKNQTALAVHDLRRKNEFLAAHTRVVFGAGGFDEFDCIELEFRLTTDVTRVFGPLWGGIKQ